MVDDKPPEDDSSNVVFFSGFTRGEINPDEVLKNAIGTLDTSILIGWDKEEESFYFASSTGDEREINWLLDLAKKDLLERYLEEDDDFA